MMEIESPSSYVPQRLVHLDLKGAPPKISYYSQIFPLLKKWGATGLLVEYEDMFPYWDTLEDIAAHNAYSKDEIRTLQELAKANDLIVIPLVQTFGHLEFVLKHDKFVHIREIEPYPMALCPSQPESLCVLKAMIDQVLQLHPSITNFHIGADEVFHLGLCLRCQKRCQSEGLTTAQLFFSHIKKVLQYVKATHPHLTLIMWDDMFREVESEEIKASGIAELVEPMVWYYQHTFHLSEGLWESYSKVFPNIWVASAFKGATGPCMCATDIGFHVENHKEWLKVVKNVITSKFQTFKGYTITGWQRYDHYAVLCELLPVSLPSLALCLLILKKGAFTEEEHKTASSDLNFTELVPLNPLKSIGYIPECNFPGSGVYRGIQILLHISSEFEAFVRNDRVNGWMTDYHVRHNFTNPAHVNHFLPQARELHQNFKQIQLDLRAALSEIFYPDCVNEWMAVNVNLKAEKISQLLEKAEGQVALNAGPKSHTNEFPGTNSI